tara:strand:- start:60 stop:287 length:228 start_codon:yes stop_codon:yes gene_type:complete
MATATKQTLTALSINAVTGKQTIRDLTDDELAQRKLDATEAKARQAEAEAKVAARESALAKLAALGLTEAEIQAL